MTPFFSGNSCLGISGLSKYHDGHAVMRCTSGAPCHQRRSRSSKPTLGFSWTTAVLAVVALLLMLNGARWLLQESPPAANELLVATCVLDAVTHDARLRVCKETRASER